jgi:hypothetical protein
MFLFFFNRRTGGATSEDVWVVEVAVVKEGGYV